MIRREVLVLPAAAGDLVAVHAGQADVEQDEVGAASADQLEGGRAVVGHLDVLPERAEEDAQAVGVAAVVVDDEDAAPRELGDRVVGRRPRRSRPSAVGRPASAETGRRTVNSLPRPGPPLWAVTRPWCISTSERTSVSPIPSPPRDRDRVWSAWVNMSKMWGRSSGAMPVPLSRTRIATSRPSLLGGQRDLAPLVGVLRGVVQQVGEHLRHPRRVDLQQHGVFGQRDGQAVLVVLDQGPAGLDGQARPRPPARPAPSGGRPCRG